MRYLVLGPIEVEVHGRPLHLTAQKERLLLSRLLLAPNQVVSVSALIDHLWGEAPPVSAHKTLQTYVSHLRRLVGARIETRAPGYVLRVESGGLDAAEFERAVAAGRLALLRDDLATAARLLGSGLSLWRGSAYDGVDHRGVVGAEAVRLEELRLAVLEDWHEARLGLGEHVSQVAELEALASHHPLRERMWGLLMQALYWSGRQGDALRAFQRARSVLVEEVGVEPGPELQLIEAAVLAHRLEGGRSETNPEVPVTQYATTPDGTQIAYWTVGSGPSDLVFLGEIYFSLDLSWESTELRRMFESLGRMYRVVCVQRRGTGSSDRAPDGRLAPPRACVADVDAVLDAVKAPLQVALVGWGHGGQVAIAFAAERPDRVSKLVTVNSYARLSATDGYDAGVPATLLEQWLGLVADKWGKPLSVAQIFGPSGDDPAVRARIARLERLTASRSEAVALHRALNDFDVRDLVAAVVCPALVVYLDQSVSGRRGAQWLAEHLPSGQYAELPGHFVPTAEEGEALAAHIDSFLRATT